MKVTIGVEVLGCGFYTGARCSGHHTVYNSLHISKAGSPLIGLCNSQVAPLKLAPSPHQGSVVPKCDRKQSLPFRFRVVYFPGLIIPQVYKLQKHVNAPMIKIIECLIEKA